jgi:hypothetical protein
VALLAERQIFFAREFWQANVEIGMTKGPGRRFPNLLGAVTVIFRNHENRNPLASAHGRISGVAAHARRENEKRPMAGFGDQK